MDTDPIAYSTHQVPLISAVRQSIGPIVEFGTGAYSTPLIHELSIGRPVLSVDCNEEWLASFKYLENACHQFFHVKDHDWSLANKYVDGLVQAHERIGVVFVDHGDLAARAVDIIRLKDVAEFIVVHDSNVAEYGYEPAFAQFKYTYEYTPNVIHTMVLSQFSQFELMTNTGDKVR